MSDPEERAAEGGRDPLIGRHLDSRYELVRRLGRGGMSTVYAARHLLLGKDVAVKVLREELAHDQRVVEMIFREARTVARLGHPNIVDAIDVGLTPDGLAYIVLELLQGCSLGIEIARCHRIEPQRAVRLAVQVASAMTAAHGAGVVHRDLKPDNVYLVDRPDTTDHCKVLDFGVAKHGNQVLHGATLTSMGSVVGTPGYMAPEQLLTPEAADHRVDIYALGVVLFEMLTGRPPYADITSLTELIARVQRGGPPRLRDIQTPVPLPDDLCDIVDLAMAHRPDDRFQSMADLGRSLRSYAVATGVFADSPWLQLQGVTPPPIYVPSQSSRPGLTIGQMAGGSSPGQGMVLGPSGGSSPGFLVRSSSGLPPAGDIMKETSFAAIPAVASAAPTSPSSEPSSGRGLLLAVGAAVAVGLVAAVALGPLRRGASPPPPATEPVRVAPVAVPAGNVATGAELALARPPAVTALTPIPTPAVTAAVPVAAVPATPSRPLAPPTRRGARVPASPARGAPLTAAPAVTLVEDPRPTPIPPPAPVAAAPAPAPLPPTPLPAPAPAPAAAPAAPRPAPLAAAVIQKQVASHRSDIDACVAEDPSVSGRLVLKVAVRPDGSVEWARAQSGGSPMVRSCVTRHASSWRFPASPARAEGTYAIELD